MKLCYCTITVWTKCLLKPSSCNSALLQFVSLQSDEVRFDFFSPQKEKLIFTPCWTELLKNVFRWIFRWLLEKENRNTGNHPWTLGTITSESSWSKRLFWFLPFQQIGSWVSVGSISRLFCSVSDFLLPLLSVSVLCSSAGCDGRWSLLVLMFNSDFTQASTLRCT